MTVHSCLVRGCQGKIRYRDKTKAKRAARRFTSSNGGGAMNAYRCHCCTYFHIGHNDPARKRVR